MSGSLPPWLEPLWQRFLAAGGEDRLGHALLLSGERGLGKRPLARRMVAWLLDPAGWNDPGARSNRWLESGAHPDYFVLAPEDDSRYIRIDQVRALSEQLQLTGQTGARRVALIDPAEAMNREAQNALLKTLEEPPAGVHLLLVSNAPGALLATVRSRCQRWTVAAPDRAASAQWLQQGGARLDEQALALAAGHPGLAAELGHPEQAQRRRLVATDLHALASERDTPVAVASRWGADAAGHIDDAIVLLRAWAWQSRGVAAGDTSAPGYSVEQLASAGASALQLRRRLDLPLRPTWLLHEWLQAWQRGGQRTQLS